MNEKEAIFGSLLLICAWKDIRIRKSHFMIACFSCIHINTYVWSYPQGEELHVNGRFCISCHHFCSHPSHAILNPLTTYGIVEMAIKLIFIGRLK